MTTLQIAALAIPAVVFIAFILGACRVAGRADAWEEAQQSGDRVGAERGGAGGVVHAQPIIPGAQHNHD